jgi:antirestriction protein ArdC
VYYSALAACVRPPQIRGKVAGHPIKLNVEDDLCNAEGGQTAATKHAANPTTAIVLGLACSSAATPGAPIQWKAASKHRRDRDFHERFRCDVLAIEEATAELTASFVLADLGIAHHPRRDRAAYIASWLEVLKRGPRAIFAAASKAQWAADWLHAQQPDAARDRDA